MPVRGTARHERGAFALAVWIAMAACGREPSPSPPGPADPSSPEPALDEPRPAPAPIPDLPLAVSDDDPAIAAQLRAALVDPPPGDDHASLASVQAVRTLYEPRDYHPIWTADGCPTPAARQTVEVLAQLDAHGLDPGRYALPPIPADDTTALDDPIAFELRLTDAWLTAGAHLLRGRIDPVTIHPEWSASTRTVDLIRTLEAALHEGDPAQALARLAPAYPEYDALRRGLLERRQERDRSGPWPVVRGASGLRRGDTGPVVAALRARLARTDGLADATGETFDAALEDALRRFQIRHGLEATGRVDAKTQRALAVSLDDRIAQLALNLERWRWLPEELGARHVRVNIAAFEVVLVEDGAASLTMKAVVGKRYRKTPMFSSVIEYVTLNPRWSAPPKLAVRDLLPEIQRDPGTIARKGLRVIDARTGSVVDPATVRWSELGAHRFPYILKQEPGPDNALGRFKFGIPNDYDIYLHDTPKRHLFAEDRRVYSSGCVRLEHPRDLAIALLAGHPKWTPAKLDSVVSEGRELTIRLPTPIPVHLLYWTAFVGPDGTLHLREDVYDRDTALQSALDALP